MPRFKRINFYQNIPNIKLIFLQKNAKFFCAGSSAPRSSCLQWQLGVSPPGPQNISPLRISCYAPGGFIAAMLLCVNRFSGSLVFMVFRKRLFLWTSLPTPGLEQNVSNELDNYLCNLKRFKVLTFAAFRLVNLFLASGIFCHSGLQNCFAFCNLKRFFQHYFEAQNTLHRRWLRTNLSAHKTNATLYNVDACPSFVSKRAFRSEIFFLDFSQKNFDRSED